MSKKLKGLNMLEQFFIQNDINSLEKVETLCVENLHIYIKIFALLYADDTIILAETQFGGITGKLRKINTVIYGNGEILRKTK
jgi:hypothetical protein